ncbi:hypothetical protein BJ912DRAFT_929288 [Pholiota molesta]|nr:hypothetical protein BJ912DRAFT_929288 [Pholiota molesta]
MVYILRKLLFLGRDTLEVGNLEEDLNVTVPATYGWQSGRSLRACFDQPLSPPLTLHAWLALALSIELVGVRILWKMVQGHPRLVSWCSDEEFRLVEDPDNIFVRSRITMLVRQFICGNPLPGPGGNESFSPVLSTTILDAATILHHGLPPPPSTRLIHDERVWGSFVGFCILWLAHPSYYDDPITPTAALLATAPTAALLHCFSAQYHQHPLPPPPCPKTDGQLMDDECRTKNDHDRRTVYGENAARGGRRTTMHNHDLRS